MSDVILAMGAAFFLGKAFPLIKVLVTSRESLVFVQVSAEDFYKRGLDEAKRKDFEKAIADFCIGG